MPGFRVVAAMTLAAAVAGLAFIARSERHVRNRAIAAAELGAFDGEGWHRLQRTYPTGHVPPAGALERAARTLSRVPPPASRPSERALRPSLQLPGEAWVAIGPQPIFTQNQTFAGRVTTVTPHPELASTLYLGADNGGIWRSTNGGVAWSPLTDDIPVPSIQSMAIDPMDPRLLYASTIQRTYGTRWLRSTDGGDTWGVSAIALADGRHLEPARCAINVFKACIPPSSGRIIVDRSRAGSAVASRLYYAGLSHLLRSDDSGGTFAPVLSLSPDLDFAANAPDLNPEAEVIRDAALDPQRPERLLVATVRPRCLAPDCAVAESEVAVYRTEDAGASWDRIVVASIAPFPQNELQIRYADPGAVYVPRVRVAIAPSNPDVAALAIRDTQRNQPRVIRSVDGGRTWAEVTPAANTITWPLDLEFSPTDANTMVVASAHTYRTTDGGQSWIQLNTTHVDNIDLAFDAGGLLLAANDGGLFRQVGATGYEALHRTVPITEFYSVAAHPSNPVLIAGGTQDNGTVMFQGALGWSMIVGGDGGDTVFDPSPASTTVYAEVEWIVSGSRNVFAFFRCQFGGCVNRTAGIDLSLAGPFIPRMAIDPADSSTLWLTAERMFRTTNRADSWSAASPSVRDLERCWMHPVTGFTCAEARYFTAVAVAAAAAHTVYGGTLNGDVRVTEDGGGSWRSLAGTMAGPLPVRAVNDIVVDPLDANTVYVAYSGFNTAGTGTGHVFRTTDGGATWQDVSGALPDVPVNALLLDPDAVAPGTPRVLFAATDVGVFRTSLDPAPNWQPFGTGMPPVIVTDLAYNAATRQLLAATYGRGIYAISSRFVR